MPDPAEYNVSVSFLKSSPARSHMSSLFDMKNIYMAFSESGFESHGGMTYMRALAFVTKAYDFASANNPSENKQPLFGENLVSVNARNEGHEYNYRLERHAQHVKEITKPYEKLELNPRFTKERQPT
ncbi:MAG: hypothetical protein JWO78_690 [Micavibrio sp.]|nr:hypothetical protein [Micavibrio sp.]